MDGCLKKKVARPTLFLSLEKPSGGMVYPWGEPPWVLTQVWEVVSGALWRENRVEGLLCASATKSKLLAARGKPSTR